MIGAILSVTHVCLRGIDRYNLNFQLCEINSVCCGCSELFSKMAQAIAFLAVIREFTGFIFSLM